MDSRNARAMRRRVAVVWWATLALVVALLAASSYQSYRVRAALAPIRDASAGDEDFAVRATAHLNERQRRFASGPTFALEDPDSLAYRFPLFLLDGGGGCSQRSALLIEVLAAYGIPARKLLIGLTESYAMHVVVEALIDGKWRVLDPLFGYAYRRDDGELATAADLQKDPELVARVVRADQRPFPMRYRLESFNYRAVTRFNWFRSPVTLALRDHFGPAADQWAPPALLNRPLLLVATVLLVLLFPLGWLYRRHRLAAG